MKSPSKPSLNRGGGDGKPQRGQRPPSAGGGLTPALGAFTLGVRASADEAPELGLGGRVVGSGSDQNRLGNQRPGQTRPRLSDQFITSERRARRTDPETSGTAAPPPPRGPRCTAPRGGGFAGGLLFISGRPGGAGVTTRSNKIKV